MDGEWPGGDLETVSDIESWSDTGVDSRPSPLLAKFVSPEIILGVGALAEIGYAARRLGAHRPFLVTDPGVSEAGWADQAAKYLAEVGLAPTVWTGVTPNPKDYEVQSGADLYLARGCDVVVVVGGGSCIDAGKGIAVVASNGGHILDFEGIDRIARPLPPIVAAPSTAGTASDLSQFAVITDTARRIKATLIGHALVPNISITDPLLLTTMPVELAVTTGLDALTHAIEAYVSLAANFLTDQHALAAIRLARLNLGPSIDPNAHLDLRVGMARASMFAGLAFTNGLLGVTHAIAHQVGGALDLPHGMLNAVLLPHTMRFNGAEVPERYVAIADALGLPTAGIPPTDVVEMAVAVVADWALALGAPRRLRDIGVREDELPGFARTALLDACIATNPRPVTEAQALAVLRAAY